MTTELFSNESRMSIAIDIANAITCAMNAAEGRNNRTVENTDYRPYLTKEERFEEFKHCRALLHRVICELGLENEFNELGYSITEHRSLK